VKEYKNGLGVATVRRDTFAGYFKAITLSPGDILVSGTPAGVGAARTPPLFMKEGDVCEVEIKKTGLLRNEVMDE
jgi:acylpyruvate hydrolase